MRTSFSRFTAGLDTRVVRIRLLGHVWGQVGASVDNSQAALRVEKHGEVRAQISRTIARNIRISSPESAVKTSASDQTVITHSRWICNTYYVD